MYYLISVPRGTVSCFVKFLFMTIIFVSLVFGSDPPKQQGSLQKLPALDNPSDDRPVFDEYTVYPTNILGQTFNYNTFGTLPNVLILLYKDGEFTGEKTVSDSTGIFMIKEIPDGIYDLHFVHADFDTFIADQIEAKSDGNIIMNIPLQPKVYNPLQNSTLETPEKDSNSPRNNDSKQDGSSKSTDERSQ